MVLKALFLIIILFYVVRTTRSLMRAIRNDGRAPTKNEINDPPPHWAGWDGPSTSKRRAERDVEDAKWVDL